MSLSVFRMLCLTLLVLWAGTLHAADSAQPAASVAASSPAPHPGGPTAAAEATSAVSAAMPVRRWVRAPRVHGRLTAKELGLVINEDDPYSVQIGAYYAKARQIPASRILKVRLPVKPTLTPGEFAAFSKEVEAFFGQRVQGLALSWRQPFAVNCNSITGALALGYDHRLCQNTCSTSRASTYFGGISTRPHADHGMRLSMLLAASDVRSAKAMIDRGVRSDHTLGLRGAPPAQVHYVSTSDRIRSQRRLLFPPAGLVRQFGVEVHLDETDALQDVDRVLLYLTGRERVEHLDTIGFLPGALADHLTSFGGALEPSHGQMTALSWIDAGATASYGTTSEPCSHLQKFPDPQALLLFYVQGATALEAYWKSVRWPQQGLFVGEPLAAPFSRATGG
ncbi:MAG: TIGR03790 family protein [Aquabacterium sp.]